MEEQSSYGAAYNNKKKINKFKHKMVELYCVRLTDMEMGE